MSEEIQEQTTNEVVKTEETTSTTAPTPEPVKAEPVTKTDDINKTVLEALINIQATQKVADEKFTQKFEEIESKFKALETPTDLPLKPKGTEGGDDIGAKVKVPDTYQSNSIQSGIRDSSPGNPSKDDKGGLKMQEKVAEPVTKTQEQPIVEKTDVVKAAPEHTFTTETPRGGFSAESVRTDIIKSAQDDYCPVLKMAREVGFERISTDVAQAIKRGDFYLPSRQEVEDSITW